MGTRRQGVYWIATITENAWSPSLPPGVAYCRGQLERGEGGFQHWQVLFVFDTKQSLTSVKTLLPREGHYELSRSSASDSYVWKEETRVGEPFEFGSKPIKRNSKVDWDKIWSLAISGSIIEIPASIRIQNVIQFN